MRLFLVWMRSAEKGSVWDDRNTNGWVDPRMWKIRQGDAVNFIQEAGSFPQGIFLLFLYYRSSPGLYAILTSVGLNEDRKPWNSPPLCCPAGRVIVVYLLKSSKSIEDYRRMKKMLWTCILKMFDLLKEARLGRAIRRIRLQFFAGSLPICHKLHYKNLQRLR